MGGLTASWGLVTRRIGANWRLSAVLALGVLVAATLLAAAPIYARAMADLGVTFTIREELRFEPEVDVSLADVPLGTDDGLATQGAVAERIEERLGWFASGEQSLAVTAGRLRIGPETGSPPEVPLEGQLQSAERYETHVNVLEGELPGLAGEGEPFEVAMSTGAAALAELTPGDRFSLVEGFDDCFRTIPPPNAPPPPACPPTAAVSFAVPAVLTGIIEPLEDDPFWRGAGLPFDAQPPVLDLGSVLPMFTHPDALVTEFGARFPAYEADLRWVVGVDPELLDRESAKHAREAILGLSEELQQLNGFAVSGLTTVIEEFGRNDDFQQVPLTVLLLEIAGIALFYVGIVAAIVIERQAEEIALLRGRGATTAQIIQTYAIEGLAIGAPLMLVAPFVAAAATAGLGLTPIFEDISDGDLLPVTIEPLSFGLAAIGALLSVVALIAPAWLVARRGVIAERRALARPGVSFIQKYYLDVALVLAAGMLLWEVDQRGSVFEPSSTGGVSSDPLLLASPALIIAAAAAVLLRVYPYALRLVTWVVARVSGVTVSMGLWQLVRSPGQYTRLTLLLMMAVAVGTFAASYARTTERSYQDRALFATGSDLRAQAGDIQSFFGGAEAFDTALGEVDGVDQGSGVARAVGQRAVASGNGQRVNVLALDPDVAGDLTWWRDDFAEEPLDELMTAIEAEGELPGMAVPDDAVALSLWVNTEVVRSNVTVWARVRGGDGSIRQYEFGKLDDDDGWRELTAPLDGGFGRPQERPLTLAAVLLSEPANQFNAQEDPVRIDDLAAVAEDGSVTVLEDFEAGRPWEALPSATAFADDFAIQTEVVHGGNNAAQLAFRLGRTGDRRGIFLSSGSVPLPALASESFMGLAGVGIGGQTLIEVGEALIPIVIRGSYELFPTMPSDEGPSVILNRDLAMSWVQTFGVGSNPIGSPNEAWLRLEPGADRELVARTLNERPFGLPAIFDQEEELRLVETNPLIAASGTGILTVAFIAVLLLVAVALLVSLSVAVQRRRVEFAVMRAMGMTYRQILQVLLVEYAFVALVGLSAGIVLGRLVGRQMLSFLEVTERGLPVEPGFTLETQWLFVGASAATLLVVFAVALLAVVARVSRTSDAEALRTE